MGTIEKSPSVSMVSQYFLPDDRIQHALHTLYDWAGEGSKLFFCDADADSAETSESLQPVFRVIFKDRTADPYPVSGQTETDGGALESL